MLLRSRRRGWEKVREFEKHLRPSRVNGKVHRDSALPKVSQPRIRPAIRDYDSIDIMYIREHKSFVGRIGFQHVVPVFSEELRYRVRK